MKLQGKAILAFNILLAVACVIVGVLGYFTADHGFGVALEQKAVHDLEEIHAVLEARYPGAWESKPDGLYKGAKKSRRRPIHWPILRRSCKRQRASSQYNRNAFKKTSRTKKGLSQERRVLLAAVPFFVVHYGLATISETATSVASPLMAIRPLPFKRQHRCPPRADA